MAAGLRWAAAALRVARQSGDGVVRGRKWWEHQLGRDAVGSSGPRTGSEVVGGGRSTAGKVAAVVGEECRLRARR